MRSFIQKFLMGVAIAIGISLAGLLLLIVLLLVAFIYLLIDQVEYDRFADPTGQYEVVLTYPRLYTVMPAMPGQGSDMGGSITICDREGNFYGSDTLAFVRDGYGIEWTETGASLPQVGEWNFAAGAYWSDDGR